MTDRSGEGGRADDETALLERLRGGDPDALGELIDRWQGELLRFLRLLGAGAHDAEDAVQETFLRVYATRRRYHRLVGGSFRPLLLRIARNAWIDTLRRRGRRPTTVSLEAAADVPASRFGAPPAAGHGAHIDLRDALDRLGEKHRDVVVLNVFSGLGYAEIASVLGIPTGTVKSRMFYALETLREVIDGR